MPVKRLGIVGAAVILVVGLNAAAQDILTAPGPTEKRANAITPENPIPRRSYSLAPAYPAEAQAIEATALVRLRLTLDEAGRIAEIRRLSNPLVTPMSGPSASPVALQAAGEALVRSAAAALWQWQYDAPANGPISFEVAFMFRPGADVTSTQIAGSSGPFDRPAALAAPAAARPDWEAARGAVRVGGNVRVPIQVRRVNPVYPAEAKAARVQGVVILEALVGADGTVSDTRVLRSIPLLDQAATEAVRQWQYEPTLLNGVPVPVVMTVTVQFTLS